MIYFSVLAMLLIGQVSAPLRMPMEADDRWVAEYARTAADLRLILLNAIPAANDNLSTIDAILERRLMEQFHYDKSIEVKVSELAVMSPDRAISLLQEIELGMPLRPHSVYEEVSAILGSDLDEASLVR